LKREARLNGFGNIDTKPKEEALKQYDKPKYKNISQLHSHEDEVDECAQDRIASINKWSTLFP